MPSSLEIAHVHLRHEDAAPREHLDEALLREPAERLPHRRAPDAELLGQLGLADDGAGRQLERDDQLANRVVRAVGERHSFSRARREDCIRHRDILGLPS